MSQDSPATPHTVTAQVRIGYAMGSVATGVFSTVPGLVLLYYLTDILGVAAGLAGLLVFLPKAWDVVLNPWIGSLSDRTVHRWGPRRPWMLLGGIVTPLGFAAIFAAPPFEAGGAAVYVAVLFIVTATGYACYQVPYVALPAEMTADPHERAKLNSWRVAVLAATTLIAGGLAPVIAGATEDGGGTPAGYRTMGLVMGALLLSGAMISVLTTGRAPSVLRTTSESSLLVQLRAARGNRPFAWLAAMFVTQAVAGGLMLAGVQYYATYVLEQPATVTVIFACMFVPSLVAMPGWLAAGKRAGKRTTTFAASLCFMSGALVATFGRELPVVAVFGGVAVAGIGYAGVQMLPLSMLGDTIAADAYTTGRRRAGVFTGLWTAGETLGYAVGPGLFGLVLAISGFVSSAAGERVAQPESALTGIVVGFGAIPVALIAGSLVLLARYDLTEERLVALSRMQDEPDSDRRGA